MQNNILVQIMTIILVLVIGIACIDYSSNLNEYMEANLYPYDFDVMYSDFNDSNKIFIHNFCFFYDFTNNKGRFTFNLGLNRSLTYIIIGFPSIIEDVNVISYSTKNRTKIDIGKIDIEPNKPIPGMYCTTINNFSGKVDDLTYVIEFNSDLQPCGKFDYINGNRYTYINSNKIGVNETGNINFILGKKYEFVGDYVYNLERMEKLPTSDSKNIKLNFNHTVDNQNMHFKLITINRDIKTKITFYGSLGASLIGSSITLCVTLLHKIYDKPRQRTRNKNLYGKVNLYANKYN